MISGFLEAQDKKRCKVDGGYCPTEGEEEEEEVHLVVPPTLTHMCINN